MVNWCSVRRPPCENTIKSKVIAIEIIKQSPVYLWPFLEPEVTEVDIRHKLYSTYETLMMKRCIVVCRFTRRHWSQGRELFHIKSVEISGTQVHPLLVTWAPAKLWTIKFTQRTSWWRNVALSIHDVSYIRGKPRRHRIYQDSRDI